MAAQARLPAFFACRVRTRTVQLYLPFHRTQNRPNQRLCRIVVDPYLSQIAGCISKRPGLADSCYTCRRVATSVRAKGFKVLVRSSGVIRLSVERTAKRKFVAQLKMQTKQIRETACN